MPIRCPKCPSQHLDESELYRHLQSVHRLTDNEIRRLGVGGSGWREQAQNTPNGRVAIEHQEAALRAQMEKNRPLDIPMVVMPPPKQGLKVSAGWKEGMDGSYNMEVQIFEKHTSENHIIKIARGKVTVNHGELSLFTYDKNIAELSQMQERATLLESKMIGYTVSDPEFVVCCNNAHEARHRIAEIKKNIKPEVYSELVLEDYFRGEQGSDEHTLWKQGFMEKCNIETARLQMVSKRDES